MRHATSRSQIFAACLLAACVAGCDDDGQRRLQAELLAAQARADPLQLWSAEVVGEAHNGRPVLVCADRKARSGFTSVIPVHGALHCARISPIVRTPGGQHYRCLLDGAAYVVASHVKGDLTSDFTVDSSVSSLSVENGSYSRTLRFRHVGDCPAGWRIGETTDQHGRRISP